MRCGVNIVSVIVLTGTIIEVICRERSLHMGVLDDLVSYDTVVHCTAQDRRIIDRRC